MTEQKKDPIGMILLTILLLLLGMMGVIYYRSIDWSVLQRLEQAPLTLPTPMPLPSQTATSSSSSAIKQ